MAVFILYILAVKYGQLAIPIFPNVFVCIWGGGGGLAADIFHGNSTPIFRRLMQKKTFSISFYQHYNSNLMGDRGELRKSGHALSP